MGSDGVFDNLWPLFLAMDVLDGRDFLNIDYIYIYIICVYIYIYICIYAPQKKTPCKECYETKCRWISHTDAVRWMNSKQFYEWKWWQGFLLNICHPLMHTSDFLAARVATKMCVSIGYAGYLKQNKITPQFIPQNHRHQVWLVVVYMGSVS